MFLVEKKKKPEKQQKSKQAKCEPKKPHKQNQPKDDLNASSQLTHRYIAENNYFLSFIFLFHFPLFPLV